MDSIELGSPFEAIVRTPDGRVAEIPWDFARHFGDPEYRARTAEIALFGQRKLAGRLRNLRCRSSLSRQELADLRGVDRARNRENRGCRAASDTGDHPSLAAALECPIQALTTGDRYESESGGEESGLKQDARPCRPGTPRAVRDDSGGVV